MKWDLHHFEGWGERWTLVDDDGALQARIDYAADPSDPARSATGKHWEYALGSSVNNFSGFRAFPSDNMTLEEMQAFVVFLIGSDASAQQLG